MTLANHYHERRGEQYAKRCPTLLVAASQLHPATQKDLEILNMNERDSLVRVEGIFLRFSCFLLVLY